MKRLVLVLFIVALAACGPSEEEIQRQKEFEENRSVVGQHIRQLSAAYTNYAEDLESEGEITRLSMDDFYHGPTEDFQEVRASLAGPDLRPPFDSLRRRIDDLISVTTESVRKRRQLASSTFEVKSAMSDFKRNLSSAQNRSGRSTSRYLARAMSNEQDYQQAAEDLRSVAAGFDSLAAALREHAEDVNGHATRLGVTDSLEVGAAVIVKPQFVLEVDVLTEAMPELSYGSYQEIVDRVREQ